MDNSFAELGLNEQILSGVQALGFTTPTPVQSQAIPVVLAGHDVVASAQTGTGKTAAFTLPVLQLIGRFSDTAETEAPTADSANLDAAEPAQATEPAQQTEPADADDVEEPEAAAPTDAAPEQAAEREPAPATPAQRDSAPATPADPAATAAPALADPAVIDDALEAAMQEITAAATGGRRRRHHKIAVVDTDRLAANRTVDPIPEFTGSEGTLSTRPRRRHRSHGVGAGTGADALVAGAGKGADESHASDDATAGTGTRGRRRRRGRGGANATAGAGATRESARSQAGAALDPNADRGPHALVITPTRELATQIDQVAQTVATQTGQIVTTVIGGERYEKQISRLARGCDMLVATPGRLIDLMEQDAVRLDHVRVLVLDEADRMLDMGFWPSVRRIVARLPRDRQTLLFSATISGDIERSIPSMVHEPVNVEIARVGQTADTVEERMVPVVQGQKVDLLTHLIETDRPGRVLVFCRTKQRVDAVAAALERTGLSVGVMHADRRQRDRERALADFRAGTLTALVATDVMSRGIDVQDIDWVINFDVPMDPEDYVHRIGRTGRAGESGIAFTFVAPDEISPLREIEYYTRKLIPLWEPPDYTFAQGRIVPNPKRSASRAQHSLFRGSRGGTRGPAGGRFGRHR